MHTIYYAYTMFNEMIKKTCGTHIVHKHDNNINIRSIVWQINFFVAIIFPIWEHQHCFYIFRVFYPFLFLFPFFCYCCNELMRCPGKKTPVDEQSYQIWHSRKTQPKTNPMFLFYFIKPVNKTSYIINVVQ